MFSCYSTTTNDLHVYSVDTSAFLNDYLSVQASDNAELQAQVDQSDTHILSLLPETYYFGISGLCRDSPATGLICQHSFPPPSNIPLTIFSDLTSATSNITLPANFTAATHSSTLSSMTTAASALLVVSMVWTFATAVLVLLFPTSFVAHAVPLFVLAIVAVSAWLTGNAAFLKQGVAYNMTGAGAGGSALKVGPGFGIWVGFLVCCLALTPVMAFWSVVTVVVISTLLVVITVEVVLLVLVCLSACGGGGGGTTTYTTYDNSGFDLGN
ncbi:hypothetical protein NKR23_g5798 [Pleurostoma richardsiae]|uniref:Uncharacterized protein n=1 Tax=Pleurostoma richardsiae TaxID=41990 RepID=A0AA38VIN9_9PEZI|nr:hypothetical protein NKR23_g5798 [Pleurostoma richardsiae]